MSSLTYKLEKLAERARAGKRAVVKVNGLDYKFGSVVWGGTTAEPASS